MDGFAGRGAGVKAEDVLRTFPARRFTAGSDYQRQGRVRHVVALDGGARLHAVVRGSAGRTYQVEASVGAAGGGEMGGRCTCPVGVDCKHVVAVLLEHVRRPQLMAFGRPPGKAAVAVKPAPAEVALSPAIETWLKEVSAAQEEDGYPAGVRKRLLYVCRRGTLGGLEVELTTAEVDGHGRLHPEMRARTAAQLIGQAPRYLRGNDRGLLRRLAEKRDERHEGNAALFEAVIETGRGRWERWDGPVLRRGEPVVAGVGWTMTDEGLQRPGLEMPGSLVGLEMRVPWYVDPADGTAGPVRLDMPEALAQALLAAPPVAPEMARRVGEEMARRWPGRRLPAPEAVEAPKPLRARMQPHLLLLGAKVVVEGVEEVVPTARLSAGYGPVRLGMPGGWGRSRVVRHEGKLFEVVRDVGAELGALQRLQSLGLATLASVGGVGWGLRGTDLVVIGDGGGWLDLLLDEVPQLRQAGWVVEVDESFPIRLVEAEGEIACEVREGSGIDWFDLDLGVMVEGERVSLVRAVLELMAEAGAGLEGSDPERMLALPLPGGRLLTVRLARLLPILAPLMELCAGGTMEEGRLRLPRSAVGDLALLEAAGGVRWEGGEQLRALGRQLREHGGIPKLAAPEGLKATLRGYQQQGLDWLQLLRGAGLGGVLADDMGLGKTVQTLAHLLVEQAAGRLDVPALVVCPTSLVPTWAAEAARFAPGLRVLVLHGLERAGLFGAIGGHELVITTYPLLARDHAVLTAQEWSVVVLDEAQTIKNPLATTSKLARSLRARSRLCLSGTPMENHLGELWSLFDFLLPGFLGDRRQFGIRYRGPIEKAGNTERQAALAQRVAPFLLRRTKQQVAADLPEKTEIAEVVEMQSGQRSLYEGVRLVMHAKVKDAIAKRGLAASGIIILDALLKMRQVCCDPRLVRVGAASKKGAASAKLERLMEMLPQMLEEGRRVLLFSQFTSMLALIEAELKGLGIGYELLTGETKDRAGPVRRFQSGEAKLFLISLRAGGTGLTLTAADTVIHYDPWWNPAVENQATDRAHRIGQDKPVFVHRLVTEGTIEEKMEALKARKQALADGVLGQSGERALALTEGDVEMLFGD